MITDRGGAPVDDRGPSDVGVKETSLADALVRRVPTLLDLVAVLAAGQVIRPVRGPVEALVRELLDLVGVLPGEVGQLLLGVIEKTHKRLLPSRSGRVARLLVPACPREPRKSTGAGWELAETTGTL
ncbi:hypothetical protein BN10_680033 [Phycicoccus elongatus Lp2]|uniref:Uncharacterized protein n=1 Tax=Phycicoccus elongatus Lp2 TaxID=1193181 RepID=N0E1Q8_9MICO|nr:hypothetical protein BN10_680033 [Phycicoccus elongatus Lp2]